MMQDVETAGAVRDAVCPVGPEGLVPSESNRARVRRILFDPLGFRFPKRMTVADGQSILNGIADDLAYMADDKLEALERMLRVHGQGSDRSFWPERATFVAFAHVCQPLPLDRDPKLRSWFASVEGQRMVQDGTLVETWRYFERKRIPPYTPEAREMVRREAEGNARRVQLVAERLRLGLPVNAEEGRFSEWYLDQRARLERLVADCAAHRAAGSAVTDTRGAA
jgi:hypothetical protein